MRKRWNLQHADRRTIYWVSLAFFVLLVAVIGAAFWAGQKLEKKGQTLSASGDLGDRFAEVPPVEYNGALYRPYESITNILIMGVDRYSDAEVPGVSYRNGGQSDYLLLLVINDDTKTVSSIQIDRDTMTEITILGVLGDVTGTRVTQICLSHGFGDGKESSCQLTKSAVSNLLGGIGIDYYLAMEMDGIPALNDALGGITVTLEDDFSALDPAMAAGATLTLQGMQAEYYVRGRMYIGVGTNAARMGRQREFMAAVSKRFSQRLREDGNADFIGNLLDQLEPYLTTNMSRGRMINTVWNTRDYSRPDTLQPQGQYKIGMYGYNEFYVSEASLKDIEMQVYYYPAEAGETGAQ